VDELRLYHVQLVIIVLHLTLNCHVIQDITVALEVSNLIAVR
jgi:hypothetical protein